MTIYLYVKTHNITGLKYLGKTIQDPYTYPGSGIHWKNHITHHGNDVTTDILYYTPSQEDFKQVALWFSKKWNIVKSDEWANLIEEDGRSSWNSGGKIVVRQKDGSCIQVSCDDPRFISGELLATQKGRVTVRHSSGDSKAFNVNVDDPRLKSGELVSVALGIKHTPEQVEAMRQRMIGTKASAETRKKMSIAKKGKKHTFSHRLNKSNENHPMFTSYYCHKDFGEFPNVTTLAKAMNLGVSKLAKMFELGLDSVISSRRAKANPYLRSLNFDPTGMTLEDVGFYFKPK